MAKHLLNLTYLQIELDDDSKQYLTINTHRGLFTYNRLSFGHKSAASIFQRIMDNLFSNLDHVTVYQDDILITGANATEHLNNLKIVLNLLI